MSKPDHCVQDNAKRLTFGSDLSVNSGQFNKDDVSESLLSVVSDPDSTDVGSIVEDNVFVILGVSLGCVVEGWWRPV